MAKRMVLLFDGRHYLIPEDQAKDPTKLLGDLGAWVRLESGYKGDFKHDGEEPSPEISLRLVAEEKISPVVNEIPPSRVQRGEDAAAF